MGMLACTMYDAKTAWVPATEATPGKTIPKDERMIKKDNARKYECCNKSGGCEGCGFSIKEADRRKALLHEKGINALHKEKTDGAKHM